MGAALNKEIFVCIVPESDHWMPDKSIRIFSEMSDVTSNFSCQIFLAQLFQEN